LKGEKMKGKPIVEKDTFNLGVNEAAVIFREKDDAVEVILPESAKEEVSPQVLLASVVGYACLTVNPIVQSAMKTILDEFDKDMEKFKEEKK
jgi:hypothetical protein